MGLGVNYKCQVVETKVPLEKRVQLTKLLECLGGPKPFLGFLESRVPLKEAI